MVIKGRNILVEGLSLDGALIIDAIDDAEVNFDQPISIIET